MQEDWNNQRLFPYTQLQSSFSQNPCPKRPHFSQSCAHAVQTYWHFLASLSMCYPILHLHTTKHTCCPKQFPAKDPLPTAYEFFNSFPYVFVLSLNMFLAVSLNKLQWVKKCLRSIIPLIWGGRNRWTSNLACDSYCDVPSLSCATKLSTLIHSLLSQPRI